MIFKHSTIQPVGASKNVLPSIFDTSIIIIIIIIITIIIVVAYSE